MLLIFLYGAKVQQWILKNLTDTNLYFSFIYCFNQNSLTYGAKCSIKVLANFPLAINMTSKLYDLQKDTINKS